MSQPGMTLGGRKTMTTLAQQMKTISGLPTTALRKKFREIVGAETKSNNRPYLIKKIAEATQAKTIAIEKAEPALVSPLPIAPDKPTSARSSKVRRRRDPDPRVPPPGTILEREHKGKAVRAKVLENGFEYEGKAYRSLSAIAREATGVVWNGLAFFRLTARRPLP